ncbi:vacuolar protein sorting-associated protein 41 [Cutaneotrichosporon oleaginosum]|uniref:Vacuolar protein sorting-associated protein 41 n=1 Tax=Cutaneotrichosporon oleaginosum TaxID=879819 RepID=A0A0J0XDP2_9TREE|nr:vacuolar protein sorting-associated protein 41 [Cutaneotrichosporon oleaginosum]KLT39187.1 vacuolar protein sorting-associated protein 41 [Cutaneotrichosporon oleaginosum]TXT04423.1 hypothetical protein COLE_07242 [Cutaneotrichosporon oleaginosum]
MEEEDSEEGDDEEEEEPVLKYTRVKNRIPEILGKDSATTIDVSPRVVAIGTMMGMVHVLSYEGAKINSFRPHAANVTSICLDEENDFVATASMEGRVVIHSLTSTESYAFDYKRPMNAIALEPNFAKKSGRAFVCGGMLGNLIWQEKGWLGYREQVLHSGEGPIWAIAWRGDLIAWANDLGVKIYDRASGQRIGFVDRGANAPRPELFKCRLLWKDDRTLIIGWANYVKVVRVRTRARGGQSGLPTLSIEVSAVWEMDCMVAGIEQYQDSGYVVLAYIPPDTYSNEATEDRAQQRRKAANPPELRIIDRGDEIAADELVVANFERYSCSDYKIVRSKRPDDADVFLVLTPSDLVVVRQRDEADHIDWLVERERYEEALAAAEALAAKHGGALDVQAIGLKYMQHLVKQGDFERAAHLAPKVLETDGALWERWIYSFVQKQKLPAIIPYIPTKDPQLRSGVYEMVLGHLLVEDKPTLLEMVKTWHVDVFDSANVISAVQSELNASKDDPILLEVLAELHLRRGQPARALPYFLRLRKPGVFDLIREHNLFDAVQEQALLLVEFDHERLREGDVDKEGKHGAAIQLLVDHTLAIPVERVVQQLDAKPQYLYMYLDALFDKDPQSCQQYADRMVELYATYDHTRLMPFLRASNFYDLERALRITEKHDYVRETVFLLGRMGDNLKALKLIIERLGDVQLAIDFAEEQRDDDLWEALITHSKTRPDFIRALLEHGGSEIKPVRLIQRIQEGLEIPGLKPALVKVLQASNLQISLLKGCQRILNRDCSALALELQAAQTGGAHASATTNCLVCGKLLFPHVDSALQPFVLLYLCHHFVHATCAVLAEDIELPERPENAAVTHLLMADKYVAGSKAGLSRALGAKLSFAAMVRVRVGSCPVCKLHKGDGTAVAAGRERFAAIALTA